MKATNVGPDKKTIEANMVVTIPGKKGFEILVNNQFVNIGEYLKKVGSIEIGLTKNSEREIEAYLAKYDPEKLKEYYKKKAQQGKKMNNKDDEMTI